MMKSTTRFSRNAKAGLAAVLLAATIPTGAAHADGKDPFSAVVGKWRGNGLMTWRDGTNERISCNAEHSGNASQLRMEIRCSSSEGDINMQVRLSANAGRLFGSWEEKSYNAFGAIAGTATKDRINFNVTGNVIGKMDVAYSKNRQKVSITTEVIPLKSMVIDMRRR